VWHGGGGIENLGWSWTESRPDFVKLLRFFLFRIENVDVLLFDWQVVLPQNADTQRAGWLCLRSSRSIRQSSNALVNSGANKAGAFSTYSWP
jgi:hypothetical protein